MSLAEEDRISSMANKVRDLHRDLDHAISDFQDASGLHCLFGCGKCCLKPDIEATPLEFLPLAESLFREGKAVEWMDTVLNEGPVCKVFNKEQGGAGKCSRYADRGMICRLFGYSARKNKYGRKEILTCSIIKEEQTGSFQNASDAVNAELNIPMATDYYTRLSGIDPDLGGALLPINQAIHRALEVVVSYYHYRSNS